MIEDTAPLARVDGPEGRRIACRFLPGAEPALVFLPGYMSDMAGGKAQAVMAWARGAGRVKARAISPMARCRAGGTRWWR